LPGFVELWSEFYQEEYLKKEGRDYERVVAENLADPNFGEMGYSVRSEASIRTVIQKMWDQIARVANLCFLSSDEERYIVSVEAQCYDPKSTGTNRYADVVFETMKISTASVILIGEVKSTSALDAGVFQTFTENFVPKSPKGKRHLAECALTQLCIYLTLFGGLRYGFVTSYDRTYFVKLHRKASKGKTESGVLISPPFFNTSDEWNGSTQRRSHNPGEWSLSQAFLRLAQLAIEDWTRVGGSNRTSGPETLLFAWKDTFGKKFWTRTIAEIRRNDARRKLRDPSGVPSESASGMTKVMVSYHPGNVRNILGGQGLGFMHQQVAGRDCFVKAGDTLKARSFFTGRQELMNPYTRSGASQFLNLFSQEPLPSASRLS